MRLRPTATAYLRVMTAHLIGRIQPPPHSPLAEGASRPALPADAWAATADGDTDGVLVRLHADA
jgi:hypothetical protein